MSAPLRKIVHPALYTLLKGDGGLILYVCVDVLAIYILEAVYTDMHNHKMRFTGNIFTGIILPGILILAALLVMNRVMYNAVKTENSVQSRLVCAMIAAFLAALIHFIFMLNETGIGPGSHGINCMISLLVLAGSFLIWVVAKLLH